MTKYSLPDGSAHALPLTQARRVWQVWLALAPVAAARGEGVAIQVVHPDRDAAQDAGREAAIATSLTAAEKEACVLAHGAAYLPILLGGKRQQAEWAARDAYLAAQPTTIEIATVYAPQWEGVRVVCMPDGSAVWCSEQDAPSLTDCDFSAEPPPGPWERHREAA